MPVTLVIPCFNEESVLPYLQNTLRRVASDLGSIYDFRYVFVDDGSSDGTWLALEKTFGSLPQCQLVRHDGNRGVAAAILTGIRSAETEIVCSIDCDCTYDPHQLRDLIPRLGEDVALVTASPYHPSGRVLNVPSWRLLLSKGLSALYRRVFHQKLYTYTSCFRVYRRSLVQDLSIRESGFLGVAEMLMVLDLQGKRIVEQPAVLEVRLLGHSKMKLLHTIRGHIRLLCRMAAARWGPARFRTGPHALAVSPGLDEKEKAAAPVPAPQGGIK
jgi:glycosyltransferase involved in cell wall biosynthesis